MKVQIFLSGSPFVVLLMILPLLAKTAYAYGSSGPIAAAFGENGFFCAIDAGGKQEVICWDKNDNFSVSTASAYLNSIPPMSSLSGGEGFLCGITSNTSQAFCFSLINPGRNLVPRSFQYNSYSQISVGKYHACAIKGPYFSTVEYGSVDCWEFNQTSEAFHSSYIDNIAFRSIVSGDGFSCGVVKEGGLICWGPKSDKLGVPADPGDFKALASGRGSLCGIFAVSGHVKCWGDSNEFISEPVGTQFVSLTAGAQHFCGIREDNHEVECWGNVNQSSVPKGSGFVAIASSDEAICGVREVDLVLNCWAVHSQSPQGYSPPLQLCSPGVCSPTACSDGMFAYNASILNEPELTNLCIRKDLKICLPCGTNCSEGYFPSSTCSENADRVCSPCSLCQNSSCWDVCGHPSSSGIKAQDQQEIIKYVIIIGPSVAGFVLILCGCCLISRIFKTKPEGNSKSHCTCCIGKPVAEADPEPDLEPHISITMSIGETQVFRLSELKDATHGFKEFNELGRGSFGFVYKAILPDGRQVAVKRANAATIIHTNSREFEAELDILCSVRHNNIVNLLGYCAEMGERLLVYEFMPHGTLHDHLHGELSPLDWNLRLKIALQAARGIEYLHNEVTPPIVHRDVKSSNILLDSEWGARIADFGIIRAQDRDVKADMQSDVYNFGVVMLEILSGRKDYDRDCTPSDIVEWALPLIRRGRAAAIIDQNVALPRNVEPILKLADVAELTLKENASERPPMSHVASLLDQIVKIGLTL